MGVQREGLTQCCIPHALVCDADDETFVMFATLCHKMASQEGISKALRVLVLAHKVSGDDWGVQVDVTLYCGAKPLVQRRWVSIAQLGVGWYPHG